MGVKSVQQSTERYVKNSTMAFLEGKKEFNWLAGVLRRSGLSRDMTWGLLISLKSFGQAERGKILFDWLATASW